MLTVNVDWRIKKQGLQFSWLWKQHTETSGNYGVKIDGIQHKAQSTSSGTAARLQHCTALPAKSSLRAVRVSASWVQTAGVTKRKLWQCRWCRRGRWGSSGAAVNSQHSRQSVRMAGTPCSRRRPCTPCTSSPHATSHSPSSSQPSAPNLDTQLPPMTINCNFAALLRSCNYKFIHKL